MKTKNKISSTIKFLAALTVLSGASTAAAFNGSAQSSDFGFDPSSQNSGSDDGEWSPIAGLRQSGGVSSDSNFDNSNSTSNNVPDQVVKRILNDGRVILLRVHYNTANGRWVAVAFKALGNAPTASSTPTPTRERENRKQPHPFKKWAERTIRHGAENFLENQF